MDGYFQEDIHNKIEQTCSPAGCGDVYSYYRLDYYEPEITGGDKCGGEGIGICKGDWHDYNTCFVVETNCSCEEGFNKVNFYDPINSPHPSNTSQTCVYKPDCVYQEGLCTCKAGYQLDYTTHKCVQIVCEDIDTFKFPLILSPDKYVDCDWISKNSNKADARREKYCSDTHIAAACPNACTKCGVYTDDPDFTFELTKRKDDKDEKIVRKPCSWISRNPDTINGRRKTYCFSSEDCTKASDIGDHSPEACGFTEGIHWDKSC